MHWRCLFAIRLNVAALQLHRGGGFSGVGLAGLGGAVVDFIDHDVGVADVDVATGYYDPEFGILSQITQF
jgi:hypothetical protein